MRSFGVITGSIARKNMIESACEAYFAVNKKEELKKQVRNLLKLYDTAAARRNEIAHATVMGDSKCRIVDKRAVPEPTVWFLFPPLFATRKMELDGQRPKFKYSTKEIAHFTACFEELGGRASRLAQTIHAFRATLTEST
jgi:hypothetical protein